MRRETPDDKGTVGRDKGVSVQFGMRNPLRAVMVAQHHAGRFCNDGIEKHAKLLAGFKRRNDLDVEQRAHFRAHIQFFHEFARKPDFRKFARLNASAGKLPQTGMPPAGRAACEKHTPVPQEVRRGLAR